MNFEGLNESVYDKLSEITSLKFKTQIKNSGIELRHIYEMKNLLNEKKNFALFLDDTIISFTNQKQFIIKFHNFILENLKKIDREIEDLNNKRNDYIVNVGEDYFYIRRNDLSYHYQKQEKLIKKMKDFIKRIENKEIK